MLGLKGRQKIYISPGLMGSGSESPLRHGLKQPRVAGKKRCVALRTSGCMPAPLVRPTYAVPEPLWVIAARVGYRRHGLVAGL
jgi:hypothetical protein